MVFRGANSRCNDFDVKRYRLKPWLLRQLLRLCFSAVLANGMPRLPKPNGAKEPTVNPYQSSIGQSYGESLKIILKTFVFPFLFQDHLKLDGSGLSFAVIIVDCNGKHDHKGRIITPANVEDVR